MSVLSVAGGPFEFFTYTSVLADNALMFFSDGKKAVQEIINAVKEAA